MTTYQKHHSPENISMSVWASNGTNDITIEVFYEDETFTTPKEVKVDYNTGEPENWEEDKLGHFQIVQQQAEILLDTTLTLPA